MVTVQQGRVYGSSKTTTPGHLPHGGEISSVGIRQLGHTRWVPQRYAIPQRGNGIMRPRLAEVPLEHQAVEFAVASSLKI